MNWFYYDTNGRKYGPINGEQMRQLVTRGIIVPQTWLENEKGTRYKGEQIPGLFSPQPVRPVPFHPVPQAEAVVQSVFCTHCGVRVSEQIAACPFCGAAPDAYRNFCRKCGTALRPEQIICVNCRQEIRPITNSASRSPTNPKRDLYILLGVLFGFLGVHNFYAKRIAAGIRNVVISFLGLIGIITYVSCSEYATRFNFYFNNRLDAGLQDDILNGLSDKAGFYEMAGVLTVLVVLALVITQIVFIIRDLIMVKMDENE